MPTVNDSLMSNVSEQIIADILSGKLKVGNCLSSKRQLANKYSVSRTVIDRALDYLVETGYIEYVGDNHFIVNNFNRFENFNDLIYFSKFDNQSFNEEEIKDIKHLKAGLDSLSVKLIKLPLSNENYSDMKSIIEPLETKYKYNSHINSDEFASIIYSFYTKLAELSNNLFLPWLYYAFKKTNIEIISLYISHSNCDTIYKKASSILECLHSGNRNEALKIIDNNLN